MGAMQGHLREAVMRSLRLKEPEDCRICQVQLVAPCKMAILACDERHFLHTECADAWIAHNKKAGRASTCPMCRVNIEEKDITKVEYKGLE